ncbi:winged helix-turn-helix domain-containing protein [Vibrio rhodolitus]|uniref:winged helix-turn-helix domain-containing protein n=1 Tax=Vibrio rhodolitus TaxID=2231649 RepID=UPI000E0A8556|nr:winged helix-turn-helix domain-containing protein [Vibrio rhodolitus]
MNNTTLIIGGFTWDVRSRKLERINAGTLADNDASDDKKLSLTPKQFRLLHCLFHAHPNVLQRQEIVDFVWESKPTSPESLPQLINRTRSALEDSNKNILVNQPGIGYSLNFTVKKEPLAVNEQNDFENSAQPIPTDGVEAKPADLKIKLVMPVLMLLTLFNFGSAVEAAYYKHQFISAFFAMPYPYAKQIDNNNISIVIDNNECNYTKNTQLLTCQ